MGGVKEEPLPGLRTLDGTREGTFRIWFTHVKPMRETRKQFSQ